MSVHKWKSTCVCYDPFPGQKWSLVDEHFSLAPLAPGFIIFFNTYLSEKITGNSRDMRPLFNSDSFSFKIPIYFKSTYKTNDKSTFLENIEK